MSSDSCLLLTLEFRGGAENLFNKQSLHEVRLDGSRKWSVRNLLDWMKENMVKERPELFFKNDTVRPGILVLINETDWELLDELNYQLQSKDHVMFISTLHGG